MVSSSLNWRDASLNGDERRTTFATPSSNLELARIDIAVDDPDDADHRLLLAVRAMRLEALGLDVIQHRVDLLGRRVRRHHDHHGGLLLDGEYTRRPSQ